MHERYAIGLLCLSLAGCAGTALHEPLPDAALRATPLRFGLHVTPDSADNPIDPPERFSGYHVGTDFEVTANELEKDVPVFAICDGTVVFSEFAEGYGGLVTQSCSVNDEPVTILYGHLAIATLPEKGVALESGDRIGVLGAARSHDTDNNRKHLHLGIVKGTGADIRGYVQTEDEIAQFVDPVGLFPRRLTGTGGLLRPYWEAL